MPSNSQSASRNSTPDLTGPTAPTNNEAGGNATNDLDLSSDQPEPKQDNQKPEMKVRRLGAKFITNPRGLAELLRELYPDGNWEVDIEHNVFTIKTPDVLPLLLIQKRCQR